jgi:hypothetical protein
VVRRAKIYLGKTPNGSFWKIIMSSFGNLGYWIGCSDWGIWRTMMGVMTHLVLGLGCFEVAMGELKEGE